MALVNNVTRFIIHEITQYLKSKDVKRWKKPVVEKLRYHSSAPINL